MKYTPEELLQYAEEERYLYHLYHATFNNDLEYQHIPVKGTFYKENGAVFFHLDFLEENIPARCDKQFPCDMENGNLYDEISSGSVATKIELTIHQKTCNLIVSVADDETTAEDEMIRKIILHFLQSTGIDTRGKLKAVIRRGEEIFNDFCETNAYFQELRA